jgi:hypothetical protein
VTVVLAACRAVAAPTYSAAVLYTLAGYPPNQIAPPSFALPQTAVGGQVVTFATDVTHGGNQAQFQSVPRGTLTLLRPNTGPYVFASYAYGTNGTQQVGELVYASANGTAALWNGSATSAVNLDPSNAVGGQGVEYTSAAFATNGTQQVGEYQLNGFDHAVLWNGTAASAISLHPTAPALGTFSNSDAVGTDGSHQVGFGRGPNGVTALLWAGTPASCVSLYPTNGLYNASEAFGVSGPVQIGYGQLASTSHQHAMLWTGSGASAVDLNPAGYVDSVALGTDGIQVVGYADLTVSGHDHAVLWTGASSLTAIDLQALLTSNYVASIAYSIDADGNVFGLATDTSGASRAVEWSLIVTPEPSAAFGLFAIGGAALFHRRRRVA